MKSDIEFEAMDCEDKFKYLHEVLKSIKPECLERVDGKPMKAPKKVRKPLGDFWVNLKDAKEYKWHEYFYEDFVMGIWYINPNNSHYSGSTNDRAVGFPAIDSGVIPDHPKQWSFGASEEEHEWFTEENIKEGLIWVKPLMVHADDDDEDEDDD